MGRKAKQEARAAPIDGAQPILRYRVPCGEAQSELVIKDSVFIGAAGHAPDVEAAQAFIARIRAKYPDANHHAWAYKLGEGPQALIGSSDDGEPGGTAGRPMLSVLLGSDLCEVVVVGTRYFGGIKLGTGGLVRAYSSVAREALKSLPTVQRVLHWLARIDVDYSLYGNLQYLLPRYAVRVQDVRFTDKVAFTLAVSHERLDEVHKLLAELTNGQVALRSSLLESRYDAIAD